MADNRNFAALDWLIHEIGETLKEARQALEAYVENPKDAVRIRFCLTHIHQVHGSLQMVEFFGAAMLAEEMERLTQAMIQGSVANAGEAQEVLMRAILQFPAYLDQVKATRKDNPLVVLPLLNDLRAVRGESLLTDTKLFVPNLAPAKKVTGARSPAAQDNVQFQAMALKLRQMYQYAAAGFIRNVNSDENLAYLQKVFSRLHKLTQGTARHALWDICMALAEALEIDALEISVAVKNLLRQLDKEIKILAVHGTKALNSYTNDELIKNLLYYVARAGKHAPGFTPNSHLQRIYETYHLDEALIEGKETGDDSVNMLSAPDPEAMRSVVEALKTELDIIKHALDVCLSGGDTQTALGEALPVVKRIADTMAVLGLGDLRKQVLEQGAALEMVVSSSSGHQLSSDQLMSIAGKVIEVEDALDGLAQLQSMPIAKTQQNEGDITLTRAKESVLRESRNGLEHAKDAIIEYIASQWDRVHLQNVPDTLREIRGGLEIMPLPRAARILGACARYIEEQLLTQDFTPQWASLDTLADAITSVEYYLERLSGGGSKEENELLLSVAEESLAQLGYAVAKTSRSEVSAAELELRRTKQEALLTTEAAAEADEASLAAAYEQALHPEANTDTAAVDAFAESIAAPAQASPEQAVAEHTAAGQAATEHSTAKFEPGNLFSSQAPTIGNTYPRPATTILVTPSLGQGGIGFGSVPTKAIPVAADQPVPSAPVSEASAQLAEVDEPVTSLAEPVVEAVAAADVPVTEAPLAEAPVTAPVASPVAADDDNDIDEEIIEIFVEEAGEVSENIAEYFPRWANNFDDEDSLIEFRRAFHTLKGSGRMVGANDIGELAWSIENMLNRVLDNTIVPGAPHVAIIDKVRALLPGMIAAFSRYEPNPYPEQALHYRGLAESLAKGVVPAELASAAAEAPLALEEVAELEDALPLAQLDDEPVVAAADADEVADDESANDELALDLADLPLVELELEDVPEAIAETDAVEIEIPAYATDHSDLEPAMFAAEPEIPEAELLSVNDELLALDDEDSEGDDAQLWDIFGAEALTHLQVVQDFIAHMEAEAPVYEPPSDSIQRALHTLKGSAHMAEITPIADLAAPLEKFVKELRSYQVVINEDILQLLRDAVSYTQLGLDQISHGEPVDIPRLHQFVARVNELREIHVAPLVRQQELDENGKRPVDPELLSIFMAEEMNLLLDADKIIAQWQHHPTNYAILQPVIGELRNLTRGAHHAHLPPMAKLGEQLEQVYGAVVAGQLGCDQALCYDLNSAHIALLDMVDAVAAGQNLAEIPAQVQQSLDDLLARAAAPVSVEAANDAETAELETLGAETIAPETAVDELVIDAPVVAEPVVDEHVLDAADDQVLSLLPEDGYDFDSDELILDLDLVDDEFDEAPNDEPGQEVLEAAALAAAPVSAADAAVELDSLVDIDTGVDIDAVVDEAIAEDLAPASDDDEAPLLEAIYRDNIAQVNNDEVLDVPLEAPELGLDGDISLDDEIIDYEALPVATLVDEATEFDLGADLGALELEDTSDLDADAITFASPADMHLADIHLDMAELPAELIEEAANDALPLLTDDLDIAELAQADDALVTLNADEVDTLPSYLDQPIDLGEVLELGDAPELADELAPGETITLGEALATPDTADADTARELDEFLASELELEPQSELQAEEPLPEVLLEEVLLEEVPAEDSANLSGQELDAIQTLDEEVDVAAFGWDDEDLAAAPAVSANDDQPLGDFDQPFALEDEIDEELTAEAVANDELLALGDLDYERDAEADAELAELAELDAAGIADGEPAELLEADDELLDLVDAEFIDADLAEVEATEFDVTEFDVAGVEVAEAELADVDLDEAFALDADDLSVEDDSDVYDLEASLTEPSINTEPEVALVDDITPPQAPIVAAPAPAAEIKVAPKPVAPVQRQAIADDDDFDPEIVEIFIEEALELLEDMERALHDWQEDWNNTDCVEELKRCLHTFKGGARLAGLTELGDLSHNYETLLIDMADDAEVDQNFFRQLNTYQDQLHSGVNQAQATLNEGGFNPAPAAGDYDASDDANEASAELEGAAEDDIPQLVSEPLPDLPKPDVGVLFEAKPTLVVDNTAAPASLPVIAGGVGAKPNVLTFAPKPKPPAAPLPKIPGAEFGGQGAPGSAQVQHLAARRAGPQEVVKVSAELLEELVNLAGETSISRSRMEQQVSDLGGAIEEMDSTIHRLQEQLRRLDIETEAQVLFRQEQMMQHEEFDPLEMDRYSQLQQLSRSLIESASDLMDLKYTLADKTRDTETLLLQQSRINTDLQEGLMRSRMVPFSRLVPRLRRIVRQAATELGKEVDFELDNVEGELDRTVLERMVAPLEHMLRNAVDHGIESPEARAASGKPANGRILLSLGREGGDVILRLSDDGRGINLQRVREKAIERGLMAEDAPLSDQDLMQFILHAGFSTADKVTQISGRGVGMDVVHSEIKQLGGAMFIDSRWGEGTDFTIRLPFTVSVNRALMVQIGDDLYAIPLNTIEGIVRVSPFELEHYYQDPEARFDYAGDNYLVRYLGSLLDSESLPKLDGQALPLPVILVRSTENTVALQVDRLLGSREIVVKTLGAQFSAVRGVSGATVMGDGSVVVILDLHALIREQLALGLSHAILLDAQPVVEEDTSEKVVMVVDDSVTVRKVTGRFLEREGFRVISAKDGVEALQLLQDHIPDVMLLDIEMPRMDGFEVAKNIRTSSRLRDIPIIMITSRTGEKHRERAFELGVNKYMGKPYQEDLLLANIKELIKKPVS